MISPLEPLGQLTESSEMRAVSPLPVFQLPRSVSSRRTQVSPSLQCSLPLKSLAMYLLLSMTVSSWLSVLDRMTPVEPRGHLIWSPAMLTSSPSLVLHQPSSQSCGRLPAIGVLGRPAPSSEMLSRVAKGLLRNEARLTGVAGAPATVVLERLYGEEPGMPGSISGRLGISPIRKKPDCTGASFTITGFAGALGISMRICHGRDTMSG
mmetsp:Transcript_24375/g.72486  ORF Transcript_24375/g.72486 Transcript_24375/m.72486 type:complete len:208 (-) Transcript_24375:134-757(-)